MDNKRERDLLSILFSWSIEDILNDDLYKDEVEVIPQTFQSVHQYVWSFMSPLLEELRAELSSALETISTAPFAEVISVKKSKPNAASSCDVGFNHWRRTPNNRDKGLYVPSFGDILVFTQAKPETVEDLQRLGRTWAFGCVTKRLGEAALGGAASALFEIKVSSGFNLKEGVHFFCAIFLINVSTFRRIWTALQNLKTSEVIEKALRADLEVDELCDKCSENMIHNMEVIANCQLMAKLNESQYKAVATCLHKLACQHKPALELIWGPPGTGKTRTLAIMLVSLSKLKYRTLTCAPTNVAIAEVASRLVAMVREYRKTVVGKNALFYPLGDILLFGNKDRLKVHPDIEVVFLDYRVGKLVECFGSSSAGWRSCFGNMIQFLEGFDSSIQDLCCCEQSTSLDLSREQFNHSASLLKQCISTICTHVPIRCIVDDNFQKMIQLVESLEIFETSFYSKIEVLKEVNKLSLKSERTGFSKASLDDFTLQCMSKECLCALISSHNFLNEMNVPSNMDEGSMRDFCLQKASLVLCTASSSFKLHKIVVEPFRVLVIDEAAQLKECESVIPLQVPGITHAILMGDECQLPALVHSKVCEDAMFGRSLFERLSIIGHEKHLLNVQYRMHPLISSFPNTKFYDNKILDAPEVKRESYRQFYLSGPMFGPLSFINISAGKEVRDEQGSWKNMVEVAVVTRLVQLLHRACISSKFKVSVGILAPYSAQIAELQRNFGRKYENLDNFSVKIKSIDGCQGGEEDVVIMSTVRCTNTRSIDFICSPRRINVSLTRARHCLWIVGDERTLTRKGSIWNEFISHAKDHTCYFNADENKDIEAVIWNAKKELDQLDDFLDGDSMLFKSSKWKVLFSDIFKKSFAKLKSVEIKNLVLYLLSKLSCGWRPKRSCTEISCERSSQILKTFMVKEVCIVCSVDVEMLEDIWSQVLKVWDVLPFGEIQKLVKRLDGIFELYTDDCIECCKVKCIAGDLEVPATWGSTCKMTRYKSIAHSDEEKALNTYEKRTGKNVAVDDILLLMKFYSLSSGTVGHLLSGCGGEEVSLPFELTKQQMDIVLFGQSSFLLSRSGTGKTSVMTTKLVRNEQLYHIASEGFHKIEKTFSKTDSSNNGSATKRSGLRQLFVTVSPKLCYAVKLEVSKLQSFVYGGKPSAQANSIRVNEINELSQLQDIPDSFVDLPPDFYPLVITFRKFLMMLNGSIGCTYFGRFPEARHSKMGNYRSVALQTFIQRKEVTYDKFVSSYWPHFNTCRTRELDVNVVFTEIMSVIKVGLQGTDAQNGLLRSEYVKMHIRRSSILSEQKRELIYDIFLQYEKLKLVSGEFDVADLVIDLHHRFREEIYRGVLMDFVYIDEVQDLSMDQIALFKYICRNEEEGFVFSGDTAQTIAKGINFRFEDIRCLFYEQFLSGSRSNEIQGKHSKGLVSDIFNLSENFRTHDGVLKLAQSVIELVYHFFPFSIDRLGPETSPINGEAPIILGSEDNTNAIVAIFGTNENDLKIEGFGAEQVILVRNDYLKKEIVEYVGDRALVLTIMECKGLEFQDVLLYNFFSTSPMDDQWSVIYDYMMDNNLFKSSPPTYIPKFSMEKHNFLCFELKQLYVAITRTKHRLWICEKSGIGDPMLSYWKSLGVIQERKLNSSFVKEIQVVSSHEDWKVTGMKLLHEKNFERAMLCFERAGDIYWSKYAKAAQLRAASAHMHCPDTAKLYSGLQEAGKIFLSIGEAEQAAQCFFEAHDYERAGNIYMESCGENRLECAGDSFVKARCYKRAAEVYSRANLFSKCLSLCIDGNFFDMGVQFIDRWKRNVASEKLIELRDIEQDFLQKVALHFHDLKDIWSMLKYVRLFHSVDLICSFLLHLAYLDEYRLLEEERRCNFIGAASIAQQKGYFFIEIDLFEKAGLVKEVCMLILWYIFTDSVLVQSKKTKSHLHNEKKVELLNKAKFIASKSSQQFHEFVCLESDMLSSHRYSRKLLEMELQFINCWKLKAPRNLKRNFDIESAEKDLIGRCARHYYDRRDCQAMMKHLEGCYSTAAIRTDVIRSTLKSFGRLNELLWFEKNWGNLVEAAEVGRQIEHFVEASNLILKYVCGRSLWGSCGQGWPLNHFPDMEKLLSRAKSFVRIDRAYDYVCVEADVLANGTSNLSDLSEHYADAQKLGSLRGEILSAWKILDAHLSSVPSQFEYIDICNNCITDLMNHSRDMMSKNRVSAETMIYFWNFWKQKITMILDHLSRVGPQEVSQNSILEDFCLTCMGVYKVHENQNPIYIVLDSDAEWVKLSGCKFIERNGKVGYISSCNFQSAASGHFSRLLFSYSCEVLRALLAINAYVDETFSSVSLEAIIFEVVIFLKHNTFHHRVDNIFVNECLALAKQSFMRKLFPIEWQKTLTRRLVILRGEKVVTSLIHEAILQNVLTRNKLTHGEIGRVLMNTLSCEISNELFLKIAMGYEEYWALTSFINELSRSKLASDVILVSETGCVYARDVIVVHKFYEAFRATYYTNWKSEKDYMSPSCFLYLLERLLFMISYFNGCFFTTKASLVEWLISKEWTINSNNNLVNHMRLTRDLEEIIFFMADVVHELLLNESDTKEWIRLSERNVEDRFHDLVLRLVVHLSLLCLNYGEHFDVLFSLLNKREISSQLPQAFCDAIFCSDCYFVDAVADALGKIGNPLVVVGVGDIFMKFSCSQAFFVNLRVESRKEDLQRQLFSDEQDTSILPGNVEYYGTKYQFPCYTFFLDGFDPLLLKHEDAGNEFSVISVAPKIKVEAEKSYRLLSAAMDFFSNSFDDIAKLLAGANNMLDAFVELSSLLDVGEEELKGNASEISIILKRLQWRRPWMESFLNDLLQNYARVRCDLGDEQ